MELRNCSRLSILFIVALVLPMVWGNPAALAQQSVNGESTGVGVTFGDSWMHDSESSVSAGGVDTLVFVSGSANFIVTAGSADVAAVPATFGITATEIDSGATYALQHASANGVPYGIFSVLVGDNSQTVTAPVSEFAAAVSLAQSEIQIDSAPVLSGVDGLGLQESIAAVAGMGEPTAGASPLVGASSEAEVAAEPVTTTAATAETTEVPEAASSEATGGSLAHENSWVAPLSGATITWSSDWTGDVPGEVSGYDEYVDGDSWVESFCLIGNTPENASESVCFILGSPIQLGPQVYWDANYGPESTGQYGLPWLGLAITDTSLVYGDSNLGGEISNLKQIMWHGDYQSEVEVTGTLAQIPAIVESVQGGITIDGEPAMGSVDAVTLDAEVDARIAEFPALEQQRDAYLAEMGLVDSNHYNSVAMGCEVEWSSVYQISPNRMLNMQPIPLGSLFNTISGQEHPLESLLLAAVADSELPPIEVSCMGPQDSMAGFPGWDEAEGVVFIEGKSATYSISPDPYGGNYLVVRIVLNPLDGPVTQLFVWAPAEKLSALQNAEPGTLVVNGVDLSTVLQEDNLVDKLP